MKPRLFSLFILLAAAFVLAGCQSNDNPGVSQRPWNSPQGWENGLPQQMFEGR
jgi:hypothetical protein